MRTSANMPAEPGNGEERFRGVMEHLGEWVWEVDASGLYTYASPVSEEMLGYRPDEIVGRMHFYDFFVPETREAVREKAFQVFARKAPFWRFPNWVLRKDGTRRLVETSGEPVLSRDGRLLGYRGSDNDITARHQAEAELRLCKSALEAAANAVVITDRDGHITWANPAFTLLAGYSLAEVLGRNPSLLKSGRQTEAFYRQLWDTILAGQVWRGEFVNRRKDGSLYHEKTTITPVRDEAGEVTHMVAVKEDVTSQVERSGGIRAQAELLDLTQDAIIVRNMEGRVLYWNKAAETIYEWADHEAVGQIIGHILPERDPVQGGAALLVTLESGRWEGEIARSAKSGRMLVVQSRWTLVRDRAMKPQAVMMVDTDVTAKKLIERQFLQAQRMEAVGQLAGGVAHDYNNILTATMMHLAILRRETSLSEEVVETLKELERETKRAASLTRQLLLFSRKEVVALRPLELNSVVKNLLSMLKRLLGEHILIDCQVNGATAWVQADAGMMEQIVMNLAVNARDAMPAGGRLVLATETVQFDSAAASHHREARPGSFVRLSVKDEGCGMDEATIQHVFEPFFTTKQAGHGTGLGLATVHSIVRQHCGWIEVESALGRGTTFRIYLPAATGAAESASASLSEALPRGTETILVVEDDVSMRTTVAQCLARSGYRVLAVRDGPEALQTWAAEQGRIDLLFTDLVMPNGLSGLDLAARFRRIKSPFPVILTSGYTAEMTREAEVALEQVTFLPKPYDFDTLAKTVRQSLDAAALSKR